MHKALLSKKGLRAVKSIAHTNSYCRQSIYGCTSGSNRYVNLGKRGSAHITGLYWEPFPSLSALTSSELHGRKSAPVWDVLSSSGYGITVCLCIRVDADLVTRLSSVASACSFPDNGGTMSHIHFSFCDDVLVSLTKPRISRNVRNTDESARSGVLEITGCCHGLRKCFLLRCSS